MIRFSTTMILIFTLTAVAAPIPKEVKKIPDEKAILGRWQAVGMNYRMVEEKSFSHYIFEFDKDGNCGSVADNASKSVDSKFTMDPKTKKMTWALNAGGTKWDCLYDLDGDNFIIAFIDQGTGTPSRIEPAKNLTIYYMKRVK